MYQEESKRSSLAKKKFMRKKIQLKISRNYKLLKTLIFAIQFYLTKLDHVIHFVRPQLKAKCV